MQETQLIKMVEHKIISFATVIALFTLVTLLMKLILIFQNWKYKQNQNYAILVAMLRKRYFCLKNVVSVTWLERSFEKIFSPVTDISDAKNEISVTGSVWPFISTQRKEWRVVISETEPARLTGLIWRGPQSALNEQTNKKHRTQKSDFV